MFDGPSTVRLDPDGTGVVIDVSAVFHDRDALTLVMLAATGWLQAVFADPGFEAVQKFDQPPVVMQVQAQSAADRAGLRAQDEILQINGDPAGRNFEKEMANMAPAAMLRLLVRRDGSQYKLEWKLGSREQTIFQLMDLPEVSAQQKARRAAWLFDSSDNKPR